MGVVCVKESPWFGLEANGSNVLFGLSTLKASAVKNNGGDQRLKRVRVLAARP